MFVKINKREIIIVAIVIAFFIAASYISHQYAELLESLVRDKGTSGMAIYFLTAVIGVIIAPVSTLPLLPIAVTIWGPLLASILSILGWETGALIAFGIARKFGHKIVDKISNTSKLKNYISLIPKRNLFLMVILFRIFLPVDILSYVLGLFSKMEWISYSVATLLGIIPFVLFFSYASVAPIQYQIFVGLSGLLFIIFGYNRTRGKLMKWFKEHSS